MRIAFLGTPPFAVAPLDALARAGHDICCVVAQPDRPAGRGQALREPATKAWARAQGVPVLQPEKVRDGALATALRAHAPDLLVVVAYGRSGNDLLALAPFGAVNVHASLLPLARGGAIQWALAEGDRESGVTVMRMDAGLDTGDILLQRASPSGRRTPPDPARAARGARRGGHREALPLLEAGRLAPVRQDGAPRRRRASSRRRTAGSTSRSRRGARGARARLHAVAGGVHDARRAAAEGARRARSDGPPRARAGRGRRAARRARGRLRRGTRSSSRRCSSKGGGGSPRPSS